MWRSTGAGRPGPAPSGSAACLSCREASSRAPTGRRRTRTTSPRAEGCYIWDIDGNRYVDFGNHHSAMMLGHSHPDVIAAVQREVERGLGLGRSHRAGGGDRRGDHVAFPVHRQGAVLQLGNGGVPSRDASGSREDGPAEGRQVRGGLPRQPRRAGGELCAAAGPGGPGGLPERRSGVGWHVADRRGGRGHPAVQRPGVGRADPAGAEGRDRGGLLRRQAELVGGVGGLHALHPRHHVGAGHTDGGWTRW